MGEEIVNALSLAGIGDLDAEGAKRSRESQEALNRFQAARDRARAGEQRRASEAASEETTREIRQIRAELDPAALQKAEAEIETFARRRIARVGVTADPESMKRAQADIDKFTADTFRKARGSQEDERIKRAEKIAELEAKLNARKESDAVRLGKLNDRIAKLQYAEQFRVGDDLQRTRLERLNLEVERNELVGEIQNRNEEHRKELQDEYIRAEEAYLAARERAEERITAEINSRANSLMPDTQATGSQQDRIARLRKDLARSAQQLQNAEARGLPTADLRARVRTRAARLAEAESVVEEQTRRVASVVTLGVKDALGEKLDKQITAQENLQPLARDMEKSRMALQNIEKALSVGVK
jgi:hypothetical protein